MVREAASVSTDGVRASLNGTGTTATITVEKGYELVDVVANSVRIRRESKHADQTENR